MEALTKHPAKKALDIVEATYDSFAFGLEKCGFVPVTSSKDGDRYWFGPAPVDPASGLHVEWGYSIGPEGNDYKSRLEFLVLFSEPGDPDIAKDWGALRYWDEDGNPMFEVTDDSDGGEMPPLARQLLNEVDFAPGKKYPADNDLMNKVFTAVAKLYHSLPPAKG